MERNVDVTQVFIRFFGLFFFSLIIDERSSVEGFFKNRSEEAGTIAPVAKAVEETFLLGLASQFGRS